MDDDREDRRPTPGPFGRLVDEDREGRRPTPGPFGRLNPYPGDAFHEAFGPDLKDTFFKALNTTYDIVQGSHDESLGFNSQTFGYSVYHVVKFQLSKLTGGVLSRVKDLGALFRMQGGDYTLAVYKVGSSRDNNIWESFPTSENGSNPGNDEAGLFLGGLEALMLDRVDNLRYAVVAHMGNPTDGLVAAYLCIPIESKAGKITRWGYCEQIYLAAKSAVVPSDAFTTAPEEEELPILEPEGDVIVTVKEPARPVVEPERDVIITSKDVTEEEPKADAPAKPSR